MNKYSVPIPNIDLENLKLCANCDEIMDDKVESSLCIECELALEEDF